MSLKYLKIYYKLCYNDYGDKIMSNKFFNKNLTPHCEYCVHGKILEATKEILCIKHGITEPTDNCNKYKYDPLKREPKKRKIADNYTPEDFLL